MPFEGSSFRQAGTILSRVIQAVGVLPLDLLVRTAGQLDERLAMGDGFVRDILERGKVLYEAGHVCEIEANIFAEHNGSRGQ